MFNRQNRSSRNAIKLENKTEEELLGKIAEIQNLLKEVDDNPSGSDASCKEMSSSNDETNEPRGKYHHDRTRYNSPLASVRPVTPVYDDSNDYKSEYNRFQKFDTKVDTNPFLLPSTSNGRYSSCFPHEFDQKYESPNFTPKLEKKSINNSNDDDDWVPLTFLDKNPKKLSRRRTPPMTYKPPKNVDLSYQTQMERNRRERYERYDKHSSRSHGERRHRKRYYFPEIAEKRRRKRRMKEEKRRKEAEENYKKQQLELEESEKAIVVNPLSLIKKEIDSNDDDSDSDSNSNSDDYDSDKNYYDSDKNDHYDSDKNNYENDKHSTLKPNYYNKNYNPEIERIYEDDNYNPTETTTRKRRKEQNYPETKKQKLSDDDVVEVKDFRPKKIKEETEDVKPNINMLKNLGKNFNACVSIASKIPDEALNFLNLIPFDKIKQENANSSNLNKSSTSSPSTSSKNNSTLVNNFQKQSEQNSRKIDFSNELKRFSRKLQRIRNEEENY